MTSEQAFLLSVLSDHLHNMTTSPAIDLNWSEVFAFAKSHQIEGILYYQCKMPQLCKAFSSTLFYYTNRERIISVLTKHLEEEKIDFFIVKGATVASSYPVPALRTMGDTDIVVQKKDRKKTNEIMIELGFINHSLFDNCEWEYSKGEMYFELHDQLVYGGDIYQEKQIAFFNDCWKYVHDHQLDQSFHFLFLILHLRKHLMNSGVGLRQFMDIAVLSQKNLGWEWIEEKLVKLDLLEFCRSVVALNTRWFGFESPNLRLTKEINRNFYESATKTVFENGVFGFDSIDNRKNATINANLARKTGIGIFIRRSFPNYKAMCVAPYYSFIKGKPWLLPIAWGYRILRTIVHGKTTKSMGYLADSIATENEIKKEVRS